MHDEEACSMLVRRYVRQALLQNVRRRTAEGEVQRRKAPLVEPVTVTAQYLQQQLSQQ